MAASHSNGALLVLSDLCEGAYFVFQLNLDHLFSGEPDEEFPPILNLPDPVASFSKEVYFRENKRFVNPENMAIAVSGNLMVAATAKSRTLLYDTGSLSASTGPDMLSGKTGILFVPVEEGSTFFAMSLFPHLDRKGTPHAELLAKDAGSRLAWHPVPDPPLMSSPCPGRGIEWHISGYFVVGTRVWVSFRREGTYSFDTACRQWRMEGTWELPVRGRALFIPDYLGGGQNLLFGISSVDLQFCACDIQARPPVIIKSWPGVVPLQARPATYFNIDVSNPGRRSSLRSILVDSERREHFPDPYTSKLAYYGAGRFCISTVVITGYFPQKFNKMDEVLNLPRYAVSIVAMEVTPGMQLIKQKLHCYSMPAEAKQCHLI